MTEAYRVVRQCAVRKKSGVQMNWSARIVAMGGVLALFPVAAQASFGGGPCGAEFGCHFTTRRLLQFAKRWTRWTRGMSFGLLA